MQARWLAWVFFGRTYGYQAVGGVIEIAASILLCFRRTTLLGACLLATTLTQVVLLDFFYDVPVKLFASAYLALDLALLARDGPRLIALLLPPSLEHAASRRTHLLRVLGLSLVLGLPAAEIVKDALGHGPFHRDPLEGAWSVDRRAGLDDLLVEAPGPWDRIYFEKGDFGFIRVGKERVRFESQVNEARRTVSFSQLGGREGASLAGTFERSAEDKLRLEGSHDGRPFSIDLTREFSR